MNKLQINQLLVQMSYVDNRKIDDYTIEMWFRIIGHEDYDLASLALPACYAESNEYVTPHRVLSMIKKLRETRAEKAQLEQRKEIESDWHGSPQPICKPHRTLITKCDACCATLSKIGKEQPNVDIHDWAMANIYLPVSEWENSSVDVGESVALGAENV